MAARLRHAVLSLLALAPIAAAQDAPPSAAPFQRATEYDDGAAVKLEMVVREFEPPAKGGPKVYLAAAVHIANKSFYEDLQKFLDAQDVVLFEGVKPPGAGASEHDAASQTDEQKAEATKRRLRFLAMAVEHYRSKKDEYPVSLDALVSGSEGRIGQLLKGSLNDAWGRPIEYVLTPRSGGNGQEDTPVPVKFDLTSLGADGKAGGEGAAADQHFSDQKPLTKSEKGDRSEGIQQKLADALGVAFQLTSMNNNRPNWRNSDLSLDQIQARLDAAGASGDMLFSMLDGSSMFGKLAGFFLSMASATPESRAMLRAMIIQTVANAETLMQARLPGDMNKLMGVIVEDRNRVVVGDLKRVIEREPGVRSVAIIYGAGHLPGIQKSLITELGYTPGPDTWRTAMSVTAAEAGMSEAQFKSLRDSMSKAMAAQLGAAKKKPEGN